MRKLLTKKLVACVLGTAAALPLAALAADEWEGTGLDVPLPATAATASGEWEGDGPDVPVPAAGDPAADNGGGDIFKTIFGPDFKISGGTIRYLPDRKAVLIRDYATVIIQGRRIRARNILYFTELNRLYAEGEVSLEEKNGSFMTCEQVYFDVADGRGRAHRVHIRKTDRPVNSVASIEETDATRYRPGLNIYNQEDTFAPFDEKNAMDKVRMNLYANDLRMISSDHFDAINTWVSPSNYAEPHWRITSSAAHVRQDEKVEAFHNLFKIGKVPVFYLPYLVYDLRYTWPYYRPSIGSNDKHGFYFLNRLGWRFLNPVDKQGRPVDEYGNLVRRYFQLDRIFADVDFRGKRGWGLGGETDYSVDLLGKGRGNLRGYWTKEIYTTSAEDEDRAYNDVEFRAKRWKRWPKFEPSYYANENRYLIEWQHSHDLPGNFDLRAQTHVFSDRDFYKEYFPDDWAEESQKDTNVDLRYLGDLFSSDLIVQTRVNDFRSQTEYLPQWKLNLPGVRLFEKLPLYLESRTDATIGRRLEDNMLAKLDLINYDSKTREYDGRVDRNKQNGQSPWVARLHEEAIVSLPLDLKVLSVRPWAGGFLTGYSISYDPVHMNDDQAQLNGAVKWGVDFSSRFFGSLGQNWTHIVEPTVSFVNHEDPLINREYLYDLDAIDDYRNTRMVTFGLHQDFYKKTDLGTDRRILTLNAKTGIILDDDEAARYNNDNNMADVLLEGSLYPTQTWSIWGNCVYSPAANEVTKFGVGTDFWFSKQLRMFVRHAYDSGFRVTDPERRRGTSNVTTLAFRTQLWNKLSHYSLEYGVSYQWNADAGEILGSRHYMSGEVHNGFQKQRISLIR
ncbi:MAG: LPS-assembly protein LptD, partial [Planctomycetes bacterium]|nr:LPS-assembly protein LptD [Planctomycetota bacterium]